MSAGATLTFQVSDFISVPHPHVDRFAHEIALICDYIEAKIQPDLKELTRVLPNLNEVS